MARRVAIRCDKKIVFANEREIECLIASGNYIHVRLRGVTLFTRSSLTDFLNLLSPTLFVRLHRSAAVNLDSIELLEPTGSNTYLVTLKTGEKVKASRKYVNHLLNLIQVPRSPRTTEIGIQAAAD